MKTAFAFVILGVVVLAAAWFYFPVRITATDIELTYAGTHVAINLTTLIIAVIYFLLLLFSIGGILRKGFRNRFFIFLFLFVVLGGIYFLIRFYL